MEEVLRLDTNDSNNGLDTYNDWELYPGYFIMTIFEELVIRLLGNFIVFCAEIYLAFALFFVIFRFKKADNINVDVYILCCCVVTIISIAKTTILEIIFTIIKRRLTYYCFEFGTQNYLIVVYFLTALLLACHWFLYNYPPLKSVKDIYTKYWAYLLVFIYILFAIDATVVMSFCLKYAEDYNRSILIVSINVISIVFVSAMNVLKHRMARQNISSNADYALSVANIIIYSYLPSIIFVTCLEIFTVHRIIQYILYHAMIIPTFLEVFHPLLIIYVLLRQNKYYKMAFAKLRCRRTGNQDHEPMEEERNFGDEDQFINSDRVNII